VTERQIVFISITFVLVLGSALAAQFRWLPRGKAGFAIVFLAGVGSVAALWLAGIPPSWFEGERTGFGLALGAFVSKEKIYGLPMLGGMALTLLVANVVPHVT
jgi:hypothetical protein